MNLHNRVVLVTGASSGIGRALAIALAKKGAHVLLGARSADKLKDVENLIRNANGRAEALSLDVCSEKSIQKVMEGIKSKYGRLDLLINNAGIGLFETVAESKLEDTKMVFATNLYGPLELMKRALPLMRQQGKGLIVNISSAVAFHGLFYQAVYSASKSALDRISDACNIEEAESNIKTISVFVDRTKTNFRDHVVGPKDKMVLPFKSMKESTPEILAQKIIKAIKHENQFCYPTLKVRLFKLANGIWPSFVSYLFKKQYRGRAQWAKE